MILNVNDVHPNIALRDSEHHSLKSHLIVLVYHSHYLVESNTLTQPLDLL